MSGPHPFTPSLTVANSLCALSPFALVVALAASPNMARGPATRGPPTGPRTPHTR